MAITLGTVKRDLVDNYKYQGKEKLNRIAREIYSDFQHLTYSQSGAYSLAFKSAERRGLIERLKDPDVIKKADLRPEEDF
jgi:hypothetical protein